MEKKSINQVRVGAVLSYINMAVGSLVPMFYTPIMLQLLGQSEYGLYKLSSSATSYLSLVSFGVGAALVRYLVKYRAADDCEGESKMLGLFNIIFLVISAIALTLGLLLAFNLHVFYGNSLSSSELSEMRIIVILLTVSTAINFSATPYASVVSSHERFIFLQIISILSTVMVPVTHLIVLFLGFKAIGMTVNSLVINVIIRILYIIYVKKSIKISASYHNMPVGLIKEILFFSFWVFVSDVVNQLYNATDTVIIGMIPALATTGVAIYNIGAVFTSMMNSFTYGISGVLTPKINMTVFKGATNSELTDVLIRFGRLQAYIVSLVCCGFIAFGQPFIGLWAGQDYMEAYWVALFTMIPLCIPLMQNVALQIIRAQNKHKFRSLVFLAVAIVNVIGTWICVHYYGIIGAAAVSGIAYMIGPVIIMNWYYKKKIGLEIGRFWRNIIPIFLCPVILSVLTIVLSNFINFNNWISLLIGVICFTLIFAVVNWKWVFTDYEKDIFRGPLQKIMNKFRRKTA